MEIVIERLQNAFLKALKSSVSAAVMEQINFFSMLMPLRNNVGNL